MDCKATEILKGSESDNETLPDLDCETSEILTSTESDDDSEEVPVVLPDSHLESHLDSESVTEMRAQAKLCDLRRPCRDVCRCRGDPLRKSDTFVDPNSKSDSHLGSHFVDAASL